MRFWKGEDFFFSRLVSEGKCLFYVFAICSNNDRPDCFVLQKRKQKKTSFVSALILPDMQMFKGVWVCVVFIECMGTQA